MRLEWRSADAAELDGWLGRVLGVGSDRPTWRFPFAGAVLEVARAESAGGGREGLRVLRDDEAAPTLTAGEARVEMGAPFGLVAVGVATVDVARYAAAFDGPTSTAASGGGGVTSTDAGMVRLESLADDRALGAFVARVPGTDLVLLEPNTEGRIAAALVRHDEGPVAMYLRPERSDLAAVRTAIVRRLTVGERGPTPIAGGPFGPEFVVSRQTWGPFLVIVASDEPVARTIAP